MIRLPYGYGIDINNGGGYVFGLIKKQKDKKTNVETEYIYAPVFPSTVESGVNMLYDIKKREIISNNDLTITDYINAINELNSEFKQILKETLKERI